MGKNKKKQKIDQDIEALEGPLNTEGAEPAEGEEVTPDSVEEPNQSEAPVEDPNPEPEVVEAEKTLVDPTPPEPATPVSFLSIRLKLLEKVDEIVSMEKNLTSGQIDNAEKLLNMATTCNYQIAAFAEHPTEGRTVTEKDVRRLVKAEMKKANKK